MPSITPANFECARSRLAEAERLIRDGADLAAVCEALGVTRRTLERAWKAKHGVTPARWRREHTPVERAGSPPVFFRLREYDRLVEAAREDGMEPNAWARDAVLKALARR